MSNGEAPPPPTRPSLTPSDPRTTLDLNLRDALRALPAYFKTDTYIQGIDAGDLFALNSTLGGTIESQVVETLNTLRTMWDPAGVWLDYRFERRAQSFPDVRLVARRGGTLTTAVGIELKGWYLLAKEKEPSFRYTVSPDACAENDLLVIVPWHLKNVLSGHPVVLAPYSEGARYAALMRNHWWEFVRNAKTDPRVILVAGVTPYPPPKAAINDKVVADSGGNFGRVARLGLDELDRYVRETLREGVAGIEARHWITFFKAFTDASDATEERAKILSLLNEHFAARKEDAERAASILGELIRLLSPRDATREQV